jgi:heavy metal sensor kinase
MGVVRALRRLPIRARLTLAFAAAMAVVLAATCAFVYLRMKSELEATVDTGLRNRGADVAALVDEGFEESGRSPLTERGENLAQVLSTDGRVLDGTPQYRSRALLTRGETERASRGTIFVDRKHVAGVDSPVRFLATPAEGGRVAVVGALLDDRDEALNRLLVSLAIGGPIALLLASLAGYGVAAAALRPVESMRREAAEVSVTEPGRRLPVPPARDEIARLGDTLNEMLARLEAAFERERSFVADASHELRSPLAVLRTELELALREGRSEEQLRSALRSAAEETDRLSQLAEDLLVLARSDQGELQLHTEEVAATELLDRAGRRYAGRAAGAGRSIDVEPDGDLRVLVDEPRIDQALTNLVENALRHGAGSVTLSVEERDGAVELHVRDEGPGFPEAFLPTAFDRFTRADHARARGGTGLGLAIVAAIAAAHGGEAAATNRPGGGADAWIRLPR